MKLDVMLTKLMWSEYLSDFSGHVNIDFYEPIQIFGRNGPVGYCLFSPLLFACLLLVETTSLFSSET